MYKSFISSLNSWNDSTTDRDKLQHVYIVLAIGLIVVAGVMGLVNQPLGQQILALAIGAAALFLVNAIVWALLQSFVLFRLTTEPKVSALELDEKPVSKRRTTSKKK